MEISKLGKEYLIQNALGKNSPYERCHQMFANNTLAPKLHNVFGKTAGTQRGFKHYSHKNRALGYQWSKQRLYYLIGNSSNNIENP